MPLIIDYNVYLVASEIEAQPIPRRTIFQAIKDGRIESFKDDSLGRVILFSSMRQSWQDKINDYYDGCVRTYTQLELIHKALKPCPHTDRTFLLDFRLPNGVGLSEKERIEYERKCKVLSFLKKVNPSDLGNIRPFGMREKAEFWKLIYLFIKKEGIKLPKSSRLQRLLSKYIKQGARAVIRKNYGNKNSSKIGELQRQTIIELYADRDGRKFNKRQVWQQYNFLAKQNGWPEVNKRAVEIILRETEGEWTYERDGSKRFMLYKKLTIQRDELSARNIVWQLDGTPECLWYYDRKRKTIDKLYVMKVMERKSWKIVGYSIGYTETSNLVFEAVKMACTIHNVRALEARSDKGSAMQAAETKELMKNLGMVYYPTATGNSRGKAVEAWQAHFNTEVLTYFKNKSGGNVTTRTLDSKQNPDQLKKHYKTYPTKDELVRQIRLSMELWNEMPNSKGISPNESYTKSKENGISISVLEQFDLFYIWRRNGKKIQPYKFTMNGLKMQVNRLSYVYLPALEPQELAAFMNRHVDVTTFYVKYDPSDKKQVGFYVLPKGKEELAKNMRFVCHGVIKGNTAESYQDANAEQKERYQRYLKIQDEQERQAKAATEQRRALLQDRNILTGAIDIKSVHKDEYNRAELAYQRMEVLGYDHELQADKDKVLSKRSLMDTESIFNEDDWDFSEEESKEVETTAYGLPKSSI